MGDKNYWCWIYRGPRRYGKYTASEACELPGGEDDAGLMVSDLERMFRGVIGMAHPDINALELLQIFVRVLLNEHSDTKTSEFRGAFEGIMRHVRND